jgi:hypothetical protein
VFGVFTALEGYGSLPPHRLSPQGHPDIDLIAYRVHERWPDTHADDPYVRTLLAELATLLRVAQKLDDNPHDAMGALLRSVCQLIEDRYELCPVLLDEEDRQVVGEGPDIAPGLAPTFAAAWPPPPAPVTGRPLWLPGHGNPC